MNLAEDIWLRGKSAQQSMLHLISFNTAIASTATLQAVHMGLSAPAGFWAAWGRVGGVAANQPETPVADLVEETVAEEPVAEEAAEEAVAEAVEAAPEPEETPAEIVAEMVAEPEAPALDPVAEAIPAPEETPNPHLLDAPRAGGADDLTVLKGVGAKLAQALNEFGIYHFDQIAGLNAEGIDWLNEQQTGFKMICARYDLVEQARSMSAKA